MRSEASQELPSFGSDLYTTTWYRRQGTAAVCKWEPKGVGCTLPLWAILLSLLQMGYKSGRTRTNGLSGNERNNGRNKRKLAPGTFITLPWAKENRALALYQINLKKKKKNA